MESPAETDDSEVRKQSQLLEKKWTSVVRLQRKVLELEAQNTQLKNELESSAALGSRKVNDPAAWLPGRAKYALTGHRQPVTSIAFHKVFSVVASASEDGTIKIWDWDLGELERTIKAHTKSVIDLDFGGPPGEMLLASCSSDLSIKLWNPQQDYANVRTLMGHDHTISSVRFTPSGLHLISGSRDRTIRIWEVKTGYSVRVIHGHSDWVKCVTPSLDGEYILSAGIDQSARITNFVSGDGKLLFIGHEHVIECAEFAPRSAHEHLAALEGLKRPVDSAFSRSFEYVATGSRDKTIKLWNTRQECIATLTGHDNWVRGLAFHPGGRYLLSVSDDKTIRCWDLSQRGRCVKVIEAHNHFVSCIRWAPPSASVNDSAPEGGANARSASKPSSTTAADELRSMRCIIATGSVDLDVKIWI